VFPGASNDQPHHVRSRESGGKARAASVETIEKMGSLELDGVGVRNGVAERLW
jgi:hypothetical protein